MALNLFFNNKLHKRITLPRASRIASRVMTNNFHSGFPLCVIFQKNSFCSIISSLYQIYKCFKWPGDEICLMTDYYSCTNIFFPPRKWYLVLFCTANSLIAIQSHLIRRIPFYECTAINPAAHTICHAQERIIFAINRSSVMVCEGWMDVAQCGRGNMWKMTNKLPLLWDVSIKSSKAERNSNRHGVQQTHAR